MAIFILLLVLMFALLLFIGVYVVIGMLISFSYDEPCENDIVRYWPMFVIFEILKRFKTLTSDIVDFFIDGYKCFLMLCKEWWNA